MRAWCCGLILGLLAWGAGAQEQAPRLLNARESKAWQAIGRINVAGYRRTSMCTGTLIAPDIVLTAAHCVIDLRSGRVYPVTSLHFVAGYRSGHYAAFSRGRAVAIMPDYNPSSSPSIDQITKDLALIRLERKIAAKTLVPFVPAEFPAKPAALTLISYRRDRAHALSRQDQCTPRARAADTVLILDCPVTYGASGAPVFANTPDGPKLVALLSAMRHDSLNSAVVVTVSQALKVLIPLLP